MSKIKTEYLLSDNILNTLNFTKWFNSDCEKARMIKKLNEYYQYHSVCYREINQGDYSFLQRIIDNSAFNLDKNFAYNNIN